MRMDLPLLTSHNREVPSSLAEANTPAALRARACTADRWPERTCSGIVAGSACATVGESRATMRNAQCRKKLRARAGEEMSGQINGNLCLTGQQVQSCKTCGCDSTTVRITTPGLDSLTSLPRRLRHLGEVLSPCRAKCPRADAVRGACLPHSHESPR